MATATTVGTTISSGETAEEAWNDAEFNDGYYSIAYFEQRTSWAINNPLESGTLDGTTWTTTVNGREYSYDLTNTMPTIDSAGLLVDNIHSAALFAERTDVDYDDLVAELDASTLSDSQKKTIEVLFLFSKSGIGGDGVSGHSWDRNDDVEELMTAFANFCALDSDAQDAVMTMLSDVHSSVRKSGSIAYGSMENATDAEKAIAQMVLDGDVDTLNTFGTISSATSAADKFVDMSNGEAVDDFTTDEETKLQAAGDAWAGLSATEQQTLIDAGLVSEDQIAAFDAAYWMSTGGQGWTPPDGQSQLEWAAKADGAGIGMAKWQYFAHNASNFEGGTYYYTHTRYHYITELRDSLTADELESAHDNGVFSDEQWDMIQMSYAFDTTDGNQYEKADALAFIYGSMSDADRTRTVAVLSLGGDDAEDLAQWLVDNVDNQPSINGIANCATEYEAAGYAASFTSTEITARYGDDSSVGNRIQVMAMLYNTGVSEEDFTTAMASFDELSDLDQAYIIEQAKTRDTKQSDFYGDLGLVPDYTQSSMTYTSESPSSAQSAIADYLTAGGVETGVTVQDYVSVYAASDDDSNIIEFDHAPDIDLTSEAEVREFCESAVSNWDDLSTEQQDAIIAYQVAVANPDYSSDDDGNIIDGDGTIVARALTEDYMDELGMTDEQELDLVSSMTLALNGRATAQEARVRYYTESVDDANKCMAAGNEVVQGLSDNEPSDDGTFDISTLEVTYDGQTMDYATWCVSEGISLNGADPSAMTADEMESLEERVGLYVDNKSADSETDKLKLQQAEQYYENTISMWTNFNELWGDMLNSIAEGYGAVARA